MCDLGLTAAEMFSTAAGVLCIAVGLAVLAWGQCLSAQKQSEKSSSDRADEKEVA